MPILRYRCKKCGKEFQVFQKITDSPLKKCSFCEGKVDLIPVPLFYNTPSFSLAFAEKEEEKINNVRPPAKKNVKKSKRSAPGKKKNTQKKPKAPSQKKIKKANKPKKKKK